MHALRAPGRTVAVPRNLSQRTHSQEWGHRRGVATGLQSRYGRQQLQRYVWGCRGAAATVQTRTARALPSGQVHGLCCNRTGRCLSFRRKVTMSQRAVCVQESGARAPPGRAHRNCRNWRWWPAAKPVPQQGWPRCALRDHVVAICIAFMAAGRHLGWVDPRSPSTVSHGQLHHSHGSHNIMW
jgi:hypothetical protein